MTSEFEAQAHRLGFAGPLRLLARTVEIEMAQHAHTPNSRGEYEFRRSRVPADERLGVNFMRLIGIRQGNVLTLREDRLQGPTE